MCQDSIVEIDDIKPFVELNFDAVAQLNVPATCVLGNFSDGLAPMDAVYIIGDFSRN